MAYQKQTFINDETVLTAENLDHIEQGIVNIEEDIANASTVKFTAQTLTEAQQKQARENIGAATDEVTLHNGDIVFLYPDNITLQVNSFNKWGKLCTFTIQFIVNTAISDGYGFIFCEMPFAPTNRVWINNQTGFYMDANWKAIRCNGSAMNTGSYIWSGFYFTDE